MLPTLKERRADIPYLVSYFLEEFSKKKSAEPAKITDEAMKIMVNYTWPGNVRELRNLIERLVVLHEGEQIVPEDLPEKIRIEGGRQPKRKLEAEGQGISFNTAVSEFEKALIISALEKTNWVKKKSAELLRIKRTTLVEKIKRYNLGKDSDSEN
jgi:DNA-binding NtrC family response regulator